MKTVDFAHLPLKPGDIVLDLGCGEGRHVISAYVEGDVQSVGVDLSLDCPLYTSDAADEGLGVVFGGCRSR